MRQDLDALIVVNDLLDFGAQERAELVNESKIGNIVKVPVPPVLLRPRLAADQQTTPTRSKCWKKTAAVHREAHV